jgi:hypothetical protein
MLAREFGADPRSVLAALRRLEAEGLLMRRPPSRGYYLARGGGVGRITEPGDAWLAEVLLGALCRGMAVPLFVDFVHSRVATLRLRAACLECNVDQQQWLCRELRESFGLETRAFEVERADEQANDLSRADLLVTTAAHAEEVGWLAARFDKPCIVASLRPDLTDEIRRLLRAGPLYFIGTDPRFAEKLRRDFAGVPEGDHLRTVVLGQDDPAGIPEGAPAYVLRTARDILGGPPPQVRALPSLRAFSAETARAILGFMVRENHRAAAARGLTDSSAERWSGAAA